MRYALSLVLFGALAACSAPQDAPDTEDAAPASVAEMASETMPEEVSEDTPEAPVEEAPAPPPGTDIHTFQLTWSEGLPALGEPLGVVGSPGYDNQPFFLEPDETGSIALLYTSADDSGETDIWHHYLTSGEARRVTDTPTASEYSPRVQPGVGYSYIYQPPGGYAGNAYIQAFSEGDDGASEEPRPAHALAPVGYYVFSQDLRHVAVFALGEPNTLQLIDRSTQPETVTHLVNNPGRTLMKTPTSTTAWFSSADAEGNHTAHALDFTTGEFESIFALPEGSQDFAPIDLADGTIGFFATHDNQLLYRDTTRDWTPIADLSALNLSGVTRVAVNADRSVIAIVAEE